MDAAADVLVTALQVTDAAVRDAQQQLTAKEAQLAGLQGTLRLLQELADQRGQQVEALEQVLEQQEEQHQQHLVQQRQQHERDLAQVCGPVPAQTCPCPCHDVLPVLLVAPALQACVRLCMVPYGNQDGVGVVQLMLLVS